MKKRKLGRLSAKDIEKARRESVAHALKADKTGTWLDDVDPRDQRWAVLNLLYASRGVSLILESLSDHGEQIEHIGILISGLASALQIAADNVDATYFQSAGQLATTLTPRTLSALLKIELGRAEAHAAKEREKTAS